MSDTVDRIIDRMEMIIRSAEEVAKLNQDQGSPIQSTAYDTGRIAGLREALSVVLDVSRKGKSQ